MVLCIMQGLLIFNIIVASLNILIAAYAIYILYVVNKLGQNSIEQQTEAMRCRSRRLLIIAILSLVLFVANFIGLFLLENLYDISTISNSIEIFLLFATALSIFSAIIFITYFIIPKLRDRKNKKTNNILCTNRVGKLNTELNNSTAEVLQNDESIKSSNANSMIETLSFLRQQFAQERQNVAKEVNLSYFNEHSPVLVEKYAKFVVNFIDKLLEKADYLFVRMFKDSTIPLMSTLVFPYRNSNSQILLNAIKNDGLHFTESNNPEFNKGVQQLTDYFVKGLKKRIAEANEWQDELTLPLLLYVIVRNNVIKYYHDKYLTEFGYESLEELCKNVPNRVFDNNSGIEIFSEINNLSQVVSTIGTVYHVYYYIYEKDINLPFVYTYQKICTDINNLRTLQTEKKLEDDLFGSPKKRNMATPQSTATELSPIEQIDNMSGEEFELFMTQYFKSQGFKTTHTPISGDYGIDLIIENDFGKIGVQAKCYSNKVSLDAVQQVVAGLRHYGLSSGIVVTNSYFQPSAIRLAADNNITLWDRNKLIEKLG